MQVQEIKRKGRDAVELAPRTAAITNVMVERCEQNGTWLLGIFSALYFSVVGVIAVRKQLENDELFTLNIARLPSLTDVWIALRTGAEQLPPFFYVLTRASIAAFGESNLALRLPAMLGYWVMSLCLFWFVSKRSTTLYGLLAMLFALTTGAYYYAFEARPYGLVLGFTGLALICWQSLVEGKRRWLSMPGLTLCLGAAISCHYYAALLFIPFACGEAARIYWHKRLDILCWIAMAASLIPLLLVWPLVQSARSYSTAFWSQPSWSNVPGFYYFMLMSAVLPLTAILILAALYTVVVPDNLSGNKRTETHVRLSRPELAVAIGFLAIPFIAVAIAMFFTGAFTDRYALPATLGLGILMPFAFHPLLRGRELLLLLLALCLMLGFVRRGGMTLEESAKRIQTREATLKLLQAEGESNLPIVCSDPHNFLVLSHYAPPEIGSRLTYLADPETSMRYFGHNSIERGMFDLLKPVFHLNVQAYRPYIASGRPFLLCGDPNYFLNWMLPDLIFSGAHLELKRQYQEIQLFQVTFGNQAEPTPVGSKFE